MNNLLLNPAMPRMTVVEGEWDPDEVGVTGGWRARLTPFERPRGAGPGQLGLDRLELEVWWTDSGNRRTMTLESYRADRLTPEDMEFRVENP
jgi:hypothetical protein